MTPLPLNLDLDALRSYVVGMECGNFALAAQRLCRSTSAVSAQLKKLEQQCGTALVARSGRHLIPTTQGELLLGYGKRLLDLNDEAMSMMTYQKSYAAACRLMTTLDEALNTLINNTGIVGR